MTAAVQEAFAHCERVAKSHYENFPIGWFIPKPLRRYVYAIYAFARAADDASDEASFVGDRREFLNEMERKLDRAAGGEAEEPLFVALAETFNRTALPARLLKDLLVAFRMDLDKKRYRTYQELEAYCVYSANPIGRIVLMLFGYRQPELLNLSDRICTAIQLVNHWQDVAVDLQKDRVYLPEEDMQRFNYSFDDLRQHLVNDAFRSLLRFEIARTRSLFFEGRPLLNQLERRLRWQVGLMWSGPMKILSKIEDVDYDIFHRRPTLGKMEWMRQVLALPLRVRP